jgi:hypothetical protein
MVFWKSACLAENMAKNRVSNFVMLKKRRSKAIDTECVEVL